jgi:hypothetical protein
MPSPHVKYNIKQTKLNNQTPVGVLEGDKNTTNYDGLFMSTLVTGKMMNHTIIMRF